MLFIFLWDLNNVNLSCFFHRYASSAVVRTAGVEGFSFCMRILAAPPIEVRAKCTTNDLMAVVFRRLLRVVCCFTPTTGEGGKGARGYACTLHVHEAHRLLAGLTWPRAASLLRTHQSHLRTAWGKGGGVWKARKHCAYNSGRSRARQGITKYVMSCRLGWVSVHFSYQWLLLERH